MALTTSKKRPRLRILDPNLPDSDKAPYMVTGGGAPTSNSTSNLTVVARRRVKDPEGIGTGYPHPLLEDKLVILSGDFQQKTRGDPLIHESNPRADLEPTSGVDLPPSQL